MIKKRESKLTGGLEQRSATPDAKALKLPGKKISHPLVAVLLESFRTDRLRPGTRLSGNTELARSLGVAHVTVRKALAELEAQGVLKQVHGKGTFLIEDFSLMPQSRNRILLQLPQYAQYAQLMEAFGEIMRDAGIRIEVESLQWSFNSEPVRKLESLPQDFAGLVRSPSIYPPAFFNEINACEHLVRNGMPVVFLDRLFHSASIACAGFDDIEGIAKVFDAAWELGRREFYFFYPGGNNIINLRNIERAEGFARGAGRHGYDCSKCLYSINENDTEQLKAFLSYILPLCPSGKTAFIASNEGMASMLRTALHGAEADHLDILTAGYDYMPEHSPAGPSPISTIRDRQALGKVAGELMVKLIKAAKEGIDPDFEKRIALDAELIVR